MAIKTAIDITKVTQYFGEQKVLADITLSVEKGEIIGLLGPSGAGKTTLVKIMTGQLVPSAGSVMLDGYDMAETKQEMYRNIGMMMDDLGFYERLSGYDNLKIFAGFYGVPEARVREVLEQVGLYRYRKSPVQKFSKGMKNRLALARAVLHRPGFLFLDEPTAGLDPATTLQIHKLIGQMQKDGVTIFLTTHNMVEAEKLCKHVALLHEGNIVEYGEPQAINRKYNYRNRIKIHLYSGEDIELEMQNAKEAAKTVFEYLQSGQIETIHSSEPDLESVFLELTGRSLQEGRQAAEEDWSCGKADRERQRVQRKGRDKT